uniref:Uncharacterized protein n=1 Tax=Utricularia reniformis TaxID=192314 RepID=A0A1Y0B1H3_9LAMI|nr:hypothetical protein AEK19_MT1004 [Utricularia reniformis]ART31228.1 hypothetical protein AEK19_MT1004 [Utricularia reniformis]
MANKPSLLYLLSFFQRLLLLPCRHDQIDTNIQERPRLKRFLDMPLLFHYNTITLKTLLS